MKHLATIIEDSITGEQICACCGMIIDEKTPTRGLMTKDNEEKIHFTNTTISKHDFGLGSIADVTDKNSKNINIWQDRLKITNSKESRMYTNFIILETILNNKSVPKTIKNIVYYMSRKTTKSGLDTGHEKKTFQSTLLYFAYEMSGNKYSRKEFLKDFELDKKKFNKYAWLIKNEFKIITDYNKIMIDRVYKHGTNLKLSKKTIELALAIIKHARKKGLVEGKNTSAMVAATLYIACYSTSKNKKPRLNEIISKECKTSVQSINNIRTSWHEILELLHLRKQLFTTTLFI